MDERTIKDIEDKTGIYLNELFWVNPSLVKNCTEAFFQITDKTDQTFYPNPIDSGTKVGFYSVGTCFYGRLDIIGVSVGSFRIAVFNSQLLQWETMDLNAGSVTGSWRRVLFSGVQYFNGISTSICVFHGIQLQF